MKISIMRQSKLVDRVISLISVRKQGNALEDDLLILLHIACLGADISLMISCDCRCVINLSCELLRR